MKKLNKLFKQYGKLIRFLLDLLHILLSLFFRG